MWSHIFDEITLEEYEKEKEKEIMQHEINKKGLKEICKLMYECFVPKERKNGH